MVFEERVFAPELLELWHIGSTQKSDSMSLPAIM